MRPDHSRGPEATRTVTGSGETQGGGAHRQGDALGDGDQDGSLAPARPNISRNAPALAVGPTFPRGYEMGDNFQRSPSRSCPWDGKSRGLPRRGPPVAAIRVPSWYWPEEGGKRDPRRFKPRGPLRGGPERSARDPQRNPRGGLCGGPARSSKDTQTPSPKTSKQKSNSGKGGARTKKTKRPLIVTVEGCGRTRTWGPLSRAAVWRAGCFWEDIRGAVKVFIKKDGKMEEVKVVKRIEGGKEILVRGEKGPASTAKRRRRTSR